MADETVIRQKRADDGRYTYDNDWDRLCRCGHRLGIHAAAAPHDCLAGTHCPGDPHKGLHCKCERFRPNGKRRTEAEEIAFYKHLGREAADK